jgi:hypothetical protein
MALPQDILDDAEHRKAAIAALITQEEPELPEQSASMPVDAVGPEPSIVEPPTVRQNRPLPQGINDLEGESDPRERDYVNARTSREAFKFLPESAQPRQQERGGFDWARALTALGKGDVGALDANRRYAQEGPQRELAMQAERDKQNDARMRSQQARDLLDSSSAASKQEQASMSEYLQGLARAPGMPATLVDQINTAANSVWDKSASQLGKLRSSYDSLFGNTFKAIGEQNRSASRDQNEEYRARMLAANEAQARNSGAQGWARINQDESQFQRELERKKAADEARAKAARLRLQTKAVDKKAVEELQTIDAMDGMLGEAEQNLSKAYTGPLAGAAVKAADAVEAVTGIKKPDALKATQSLQANIEQAISDLRKARFGSSLTSGERAAMLEWKPGVQLSEESNRNLIAALRKYMGYRSQQRLQQVYKETGMPIYMPPDRHLSLEDAKILKAEYEGIDKYDDETAAGTVDRVNEVLRKYGGYVSGSYKPPQGRQGTEATPTQGPALRAPPGAKAGDRKRNPKDGKIYIVQPDGTMKPE